jgi:hypothetical protein
MHMLWCGMRSYGCTQAGGAAGSVVVDGENFSAELALPAELARAVGQVHLTSLPSCW